MPIKRKVKNKKKKINNNVQQNNNQTITINLDKIQKRTRRKKASNLKPSFQSPQFFFSGRQYPPIIQNELFNKSEATLFLHDFKNESNKAYKRLMDAHQNNYNQYNNLISNSKTQNNTAVTENNNVNNTAVTENNNVNTEMITNNNGVPVKEHIKVIKKVNKQHDKELKNIENDRMNGDKDFKTTGIRGDECFLCNTGKMVKIGQHETTDKHKNAMAHIAANKFYMDGDSAKCNYEGCGARVLGRNLKKHISKHEDKGHELNRPVPEQEKQGDNLPPDENND